MVTVTVADSFGASDTVKFIFNVTETPVNDTVTLEGTSGKDVIFDDRLYRILSGNGGQDKFVFNDTFGNDTITDFHAGQNVIQIEQAQGNFVDFNSLISHATSVGINNADTLLDDGLGDTILLQNVQLGSLSANDFILHPGVGA